MQQRQIVSAAPRQRYVTLNWCGCPNIKICNVELVRVSKYRAQILQNKVCKKIFGQVGSSFEANLDTLGSKILPNRTPNHGQSLSVSLKYLVNICTVMTKKTSRYHTAILPLCFKSSCQHMPKGTKSTKNDGWVSIIEIHSLSFDCLGVFQVTGS